MQISANGQGVVIYIDGSARPTSPGHLGWGFHGYIYKATTAKNFVTIKDASLCPVEQQITSHGYVATEKAKHISDTISPVQPVMYLDHAANSGEISSSNYAEMKALYSALEKIKTIENLESARLITDSDFVRKGLLDQCRTWEYHNWKKPDGTFIPHHELWIKLYNLFRQIKATGTWVEVYWTKGHSDSHGNNMANILAGIAANAAVSKNIISSYIESPAQSYWKVKVERHPLFCFSRMYFNSKNEYNQPGVYFQADPGVAEQLIGRRTPDASFCVLKMNTPIAPVEQAFARHSMCVGSGSTNRITMLKVDSLYGKGVFPYFETFGSDALTYSKRNRGLEFFERASVTVEQDPTGLSLRAIENANYLEAILDSYLCLKKTGDLVEKDFFELEIHPVTEFFFEKAPPKKPGGLTKLILKPEFIPGFRDTRIPVTVKYKQTQKHIKIPIIMGLDTPPRNNVKRLETLNPCLDLITWKESEHSLRYAVVVSCDDGVGIWSNFFSDRIFLRD